MLASEPELTAGIPGTGPLTIEQIKQWLVDQKHHEPLSVRLPLGLDSGQATVVGVDESWARHNPLTRAKIELGRQLFFDARLSADGTVSCASCHDPNQGYTVHTKYGVGVDGQEGNRNPPAAFNRVLGQAQFWDGNAGSLEDAVKRAIADPIEMANTHEKVAHKILTIEGYRLQFEAIFGDGHKSTDVVTIDNIARAIAAFCRVTVTGPSPFDYHDRHLRLETMFKAKYGDVPSSVAALEQADMSLYEQYRGAARQAQVHQFSVGAERGRKLFFGDRARCSVCHAGPNLSDEQFHNIGIGMDRSTPDLGRYAVTKDANDRGSFKTPTIRNVALTYPYMHDGSLNTLEEVVEWYDRGGHPREINPNQSDKLRQLHLTVQEKADLVEFMRACTGEFAAVATGRLPD